MIADLPPGPLAPLRARDFRLLFSARVVSFLGSAMAPVALAFAVLDLTGSKADLGYVLAARAVPQVVLLLAGGVWADRLPRNQVMVASNVVSAASQATIAALLLSGHARVWHLAALGAVNGVSAAFFFPASQGVIPQLVPEELRQQGNALLRLGINATNITGAALGGLLVAATSPGTAIALDSGTFVVAAVLTAGIRLPEISPAAVASFVAELREGWQEFSTRTWLWAITLQFALVNAVWAASIAVLGPVVAKDHLGGAAAWGLVLASQAAGLVAAGLVLLRIRPARLLRTATFGIFASIPLLVSLALPLPLAAVAAFAVATGLGMETFGVLWDTAMQQEIPADKLSRVYSYDALGSFVLIPVGFAAIGPIAAAIGTRDTLFLAAAVIVSATLAVLTVGEVRQLRRREVFAA